MSCGRQQQSILNLCSALSFYGWSIYGYNEDESDLQVDYYHPASWDGIAVKNGYILVVDNYNGGSIGGDFIHRSYDQKIANRITKLQALIDCPSASQGERDNAQSMVDKFDKRLVEEITIKGDLPAVEYQKNPGNSKWHIEKNGDIIAKGTGVYQFGIYGMFNRASTFINYNRRDANCEHTLSAWNIDSWDDFVGYRKKENEDDVKFYDKFFGLINKWEKLVALKLGAGEEEKLVKKTVTKKVVHYIAKESDKPTEYVKLGPGWIRNYGLECNRIYKTTKNEHGISIKKLTCKYITFKSGDLKHERTYKLEPNKSTKPGYLHAEAEDYEKGRVLYIKMVKYTEIFEEVVFVKESKKPSVKESKKPFVEKTQIQPKENTACESNETEIDFQSLIDKGEVVDYEHTKTKDMLKVLKLKVTLSIDHFKQYCKFIKVNKIGYYSKYAKGVVLTSA